MALPAAIQAQVEQADALLAAMNAPPEAGAAPEQTPAAAEPAPQTAPTESVVPQAETQTPAVPLKPAPEETWESRYKTLHGIFNREIPTLQQTVKDLTRRLEQTELARTEADKPKPESAAHKPEADPKDVENFGSDLVDMVQRVAERTFGGVAQRVDAEVSKFAERLTALEQQLAGTTRSVAVTAEEKFFDKLGAKVPNWEAINTDPRFLEWLQVVDPVYGIPRQVALSNAREQLDAARAINVFSAFLEPNIPNSPTAPNPVDKQVSPRTGAANPAPVQPAQQHMTQKQISDFYNDMARRRYAGREAEAVEIERAINLAIAEGRVR